MKHPPLKGAEGCGFTSSKHPPSPLRKGEDNVQSKIIGVVHATSHSQS